MAAKRVIKPSADATPVVGDASDALANRLQYVRDHASEIVAATDAAVTGGADRGYAANVAASQSIGFTWEEALGWEQSPLDARLKAEPGELAIRELHVLASPDTSYKAIEAAKARLQHVVDASRPDIAEAGHEKTRTITKQSDPCDAAAAFKALKAERKAFADAGDSAGVALLDQHLAAKDDLGRMFSLANKVSAAVKRYQRFRSSLFLHLVADTFEQVVPEEERGKYYEKASDTALAAHKSYMATERQLRGVDDLRNAVTTAVRNEFKGKFVFNELAAPKSHKEQVDDAVARFYGAVNRLFKLEAITAAQCYNIKYWLGTATKESQVPSDVEGAEPVHLIYPEPVAKPKATTAAAKPKASKKPKAPPAKTARGKARNPAPPTTPGKVAATPTPATTAKVRGTVPPVPGKAAPVKSASKAQAERLMADLS